ncbi:hypothetical protein HDV01_001924 [Terramyces sp. JEL0728]|nr:hypothetical protein HDV01_001924 [Terramyces sp. JEL0728]
MVCRKKLIPVKSISVDPLNKEEMGIIQLDVYAILHSKPSSLLYRKRIIEKEIPVKRGRGRPKKIRPVSDSGSEKEPSSPNGMYFSVAKTTVKS